MERYVASKQLESLINIMFDWQDVICSKVSRVISLAVRTKKPWAGIKQVTSSGDLVSAKTCSEFPLIIASGDINKQDDASEFQAILKIMAKRRSGEAAKRIVLRSDWVAIIRFNAIIHCFRIRGRFLWPLKWNRRDFIESTIITHF